MIWEYLQAGDRREEISAELERIQADWRLGASRKSEMIAALHREDSELLRRRQELSEKIYEDRDLARKFERAVGDHAVKKKEQEILERHRRQVEVGRSKVENRPLPQITTREAEENRREIERLSLTPEERLAQAKKEENIRKFGLYKMPEVERDPTDDF